MQKKILHHLGYIKACKHLDTYQLVSRISEPSTVSSISRFKLEKCWHAKGHLPIHWSNTCRVWSITICANLYRGGNPKALTKTHEENEKNPTLLSIESWLVNSGILISWFIKINPYITASSSPFCSPNSALVSNPDSEPCNPVELWNLRVPCLQQDLSDQTCQAFGLSDPKFFGGQRVLKRRKWVVSNENQGNLPSFETGRLLLWKSSFLSTSESDEGYKLLYNKTSTVFGFCHSGCI